MIETTLKLLRSHGACKDRYKVLHKALGPKYGDITPIGLDRILEINGLDDAIWALRAVKQTEERDRLARLFACRCVRETPLGDGRKVWDLLDESGKNAVVVAERFAVGKATEKELARARAAAAAAAAAGAAAGAAAAAAAWAAAGAAAAAAAWAAAAAAARAAAWDFQKETLREMLASK